MPAQPVLKTYGTDTLVWLKQCSTESSYKWMMSDQGTQTLSSWPRGEEFRELEIDCKLGMGVINPDQIKMAVQIVSVQKINWTFRFCVDCRELHAVMICGTYPIPHMNEYIETAGEARIHSTLESNSSGWKTKISKDYKDKTVFTLHHGQFRFTRMHLGWKLPEKRLSKRKTSFSLS